MNIKNINYIYDHAKIKEKIFVDYNNIPISNVYIYKITNLLNDQCYIGKTHNIGNRVSQYIWMGINKDKSIHNRKDIRIIKAIRKYGIDNFRIEIIDTCETDEESVCKEKKYIHDFKSIDNGYNFNDSSTYQNSNSRANNGNYGHKHTSDTKLKKSKIVVAINITTKKIIFSTGMKLLGDYLHIGRDIISHAKNRCGTVDGYYIISLYPDEHKHQLDYIDTLLKKGSNQIRLYEKCNGFIYANNLVFKTLQTEKLNSMFSYRVITQDDNSDTGYIDIGMEIIYDYYNMNRHF